MSTNRLLESFFTIGKDYIKKEPRQPHFINKKSTNPQEGQHLVLPCDTQSRHREI